MLEHMILAYGISHNVECDKFHIYALSKSHIKLFFDGEDWTKQEADKAETSDFTFAYEMLGEILNSEEQRDRLEASFLF